MELKIEVMIVEDSIGWRKVIRRELELRKESGIEVIGEAGNGVELMEKLKYLKPSLILLDLEMPEMDGNATLNHLQEEFPDIGIIIISFYSDSALRDDYCNRGVGAYISKDEASDITWLISVIKKVHTGKPVHGNYQKTKFVLTEIQKDILQLKADGKSQKEIGNEIGMTPDGVGKQVKKIMKKMGFQRVNFWSKYIVKAGFEFLRKPKRSEG